MDDVESDAMETGHVAAMATNTSTVSVESLDQHLVADPVDLGTLAEVIYRLEARTQVFADEDEVDQAFLQTQQLMIDTLRIVMNHLVQEREEQLGPAPPIEQLADHMVDPNRYVFAGVQD